MARSVFRRFRPSRRARRALAALWAGLVLPSLVPLPTLAAPDPPEPHTQGQACTVDLEGAISIPAPTAPDTLPASLHPHPNPLLTPTDPEEVIPVDSQPITLEQAIELAYRHNPGLEGTRLALAQSEAALAETLASLLPTIDLGASLDYLSAPSSAVGDETGLNEGSTLTTASAEIAANYAIGTGGRRQATIAAAELAVRQQQLVLEQTAITLRLTTINQYYDVQQAVEQIRIARDFLTEACRNLRDTQLFLEAEVGTRFDVLRAEVQVATARQDLIRALSTWRTAQRQLAEQLNLPPNREVQTTAVAPAGTWPLSLAESIVLAWQNRAELEQALLERELGATQADIAQSASRAQFNAFGTLNGLSLLSPNLDDIDTLAVGGTVGAQTTWRVFDGGAAAAGVVQAERQTDIGTLRYGQTRNQVRQEVEQAYYTLEANFTNIDTAQASVEQAREALRLARRRFDAGVGDQLEVLTAQSALTEAEGNLVNAILGYNRALAALERAVSNLDGPVSQGGGGRG